MSSREGYKGERVSKMPRIIDLGSNGLRISVRLANKTKQKYGLFYKLASTLVGSCEMANNPHIFLTEANQHIQ